MNEIHKYKLPTDGNGRELLMREGAKIIHAGIDPRGEKCVWAIVNTDKEMKRYEAHVIGTEWEIPDGCNYCGTFLEGSFVWHVFIK